MLWRRAPLAQYVGAWMSLQLRDYQLDLVQDVRALLAQGHRRVLAQAPTGAGKTAMAAYMIGGAAAKGLTVGMFVHRVELVRQTRTALLRQGIDHGVIAAGEPYNPHHKVYVCGIQTLAKRLDRAPQFDFVFVDEAHHAVSRSWADTLNALDPRWVVGLSATPCRLDGRGLREQFEALAMGPSVEDLMERGFLSRYRVFAPTTVDMTGARRTAGDFNSADMADRLDKPAIHGSAIAHYQQLCAGKRAVVFCVSIKHAEHVAAAFLAAGVPAKAISGKTPPAERAAALAAFEAGRILVLTSCDLVSEGFDLPAIEAAICLRPTASLSLHIQQIGRCLRPAPGKSEAIILDHVGNCARHGLPDEPQDWSLDATARKPAGERGEINPVRSCVHCYHVFRPAPVCPACGQLQPSGAREVEEVDGQLAELDSGAIKAARIKLRSRVIPLAIVHQTARAVLVHTESKAEVWLPKSKIEVGDRTEDGRWLIKVPGWLLTEKGLAA